MEKTLANFFIGGAHRGNDQLFRKAKILLNASLLTSIFSANYLVISLVIDFQPGIYLMIFNVLGYILLPFLLRTRLPLFFTGNLYVLMGALAVLGVVYYSGGMDSLILPWLAASPTLALLIIGRKSAWLWALINISFVILFSVLQSNGIHLSIAYDQAWHEVFGAIVVSGLILILLVVSLVFEGHKNQAIKETEEKNDELQRALEKLESTKKELEISYRDLKENNQLLEEQTAEILAQRDLIEERNEDLRLLNEEKNYVMGVLAHDLKGPVNHISGFAGLLQMEGENLSEEQKEYVKRIISSTEKSKHLISKLLNFRILEQNKSSLNNEIVDLNEVLDDVVKEYQLEASQKHIEINMELKIREPFAFLDKIYVTQVFENLISNAIKFSDSGSQIKIVQLEIDGLLRTEVIDEGPGISMHEMPRLFGEFNRLTAQPTAGESSTGLGLSIVKRYVELMRGKVWCESELGVGSKFIVEFPVSQTAHKPTNNLKKA